ncbi:MAG: class I SAM-dependent methyltransferase [Pirellulales bacterium]|nr:class I SAM-dependent methyltransferase [Pirellulales bacterium]
MNEQALLYTELAEWWPLLSPHWEYEQEATFFESLLVQACQGRAETMLELGSGGGNNAYYLKKRFASTLVDRSPQMLAVSRQLNPDCEHVEGDMRTVRLNRKFDCVFVHDAICYMTCEAELRNAVQTAALHCRPGGAILFVPDHLKENFRPSTDCGGHDGVTRSLRYLEWTWDPDAADTTYTVDYTYVMREGTGVPRVVQERHVEGLFTRPQWMKALSDAGLHPSIVPAVCDGEESNPREIFVGSARA